MVVGCCCGAYQKFSQRKNAQNAAVQDDTFTPQQEIPMQTFGQYPQQSQSTQYIPQQTHQFNAQPPPMAPPQYAPQQFGTPPAYQPPPYSFK